MVARGNNMRNLNDRLKNRIKDNKKLINYGFKMYDNKYMYSEKICNNQFERIVEIKDNLVTSKLIDLLNEEEYVLVDVQDSIGEFVGKVRQEYEGKLDHIINNCTEKEIFKQNQTKQIIKYIKEKYEDELEFLWEKLENAAIWRNKQNNKWYGLLMKIEENKLGINSERMVEAINVRYQKEESQKIVDNKKIFPGYHMNKKSWITIKLDNSVETRRIKELIDNSYNLSLGGKRIHNKQSDLAQKVYEYLLSIPEKKVVTYKQVAEYLGNKGLARVVGNILHKNPDGDKYPCYKVLNSKGELAENFVFGGKNIQKERLEKEGIKVKDGKVDLKIYQWK